MRATCRHEFLPDSSGALLPPEETDVLIQIEGNKGSITNGEITCRISDMGTELMVSIWPTVDGECENYEQMREMGYLARSEYGKRLGQLGHACFDPTNPDARSFVWDRIKENYYRHGIRIFWLDEAEPEYTDY